MVLHPHHDLFLHCKLGRLLDGRKDGGSNQLCWGFDQADQNQVRHILLWIHQLLLQGYYNYILLLSILLHLSSSTLRYLCFYWSMKQLRKKTKNLEQLWMLGVEMISSPPVGFSFWITHECFYLQSSTIPTYQKLNAVMESAKPSVYTDGNSGGIDRVRKEDGFYAFFMEAAVIEYHIERKCDLTMIGGLLDSKGYGIALPLSEFLSKNITNWHY